MVSACARNPHGPNMQQSTSECCAGTSAASASRKTCLATNKSILNKCIHADAAVSAVPKHPLTNVNQFPMKSPLAVTPETNVESSARTAGLRAVASIDTKYRAPMNANGAAERMNLRVDSALGAPIIAPYRGSTATVPIENTVSGSAAGTMDDPREPVLCGVARDRGCRNLLASRWLDTRRTAEARQRAASRARPRRSRELGATTEETAPRARMALDVALARARGSGRDKFRKDVVARFFVRITSSCAR